MPLYRNPDFRRPPSGLARLFDVASGDSFLALPAWYDLMARHGVPAESEILVYTDERPGSATALLLQTGAHAAGLHLRSLANAYSVEHEILSGAGTDPAAGLAAIVSEVVAERPLWDRLSLAELDPQHPSYRAAVRSLRRAGLLVECTFHSGTWYEETAALSFADYLAARPSELRNTWRRKQRRIERGNRLTKAFFSDSPGIGQAIADYQQIYAASWKPAEDFPEFIPALIRLAAELGALRLGIYYIDGMPAAAQVWTLWNGRAIIHKLAHDLRYDDLSLGTLLTMEMVERALLDDRPREITLGRGDDPYKKLWLPKRRERWGITAASPWTRRGLSFGLKREAAKAYHRLRGERVTPFD
jgi:Acetyltransferase (GNAT) domain